LALGGYTNGESFVARNVGLKSFWHDGQWQVEIVFMDHDDMYIVGNKYFYFHPNWSLTGMAEDEIYIFATILKMGR
jgi:hypothetical protein